MNGRRNRELIGEGTIEAIVRSIRNFAPDAVVYLVGSYANNTATPGSDLDIVFVTEKNRQKTLAKEAKETLGTRFQPICKKIDCKIITQEDLHQGPYLMCYSMITGGKCLTEEPIEMKLSPKRLLQELNRLVEQRQEIEEMINNKTNFNISGALLFNMGKSLHFLERIVAPEDYWTLKDIWGRNLSFLGRIYENSTSKGVMTSLTVELDVKKQRSGNYDRLHEALGQLKRYEARVTDGFNLWYESNTDRSR